jgi:transcriptional regulator with XRE-family HTH domain
MPDSAVGLAGLELAKAIRSKRYKALIGLLVARREAAEMTQSDLAARLGKSRSFVARLESGHRRITVVEFMTLAKILSFNPCKIISTLEKMPPAMTGTPALAVPAPVRWPLPSLAEQAKPGLNAVKSGIGIRAARSFPGFRCAQSGLLARPSPAAGATSAM